MVVIQILVDKALDQFGPCETRITTKVERGVEIDASG